MLVGYGTKQMHHLSEYFGQLSANNQTFGARSNEARLASMCFRQAACNRQVKSTGISVYTPKQGFGPHYDTRNEEYGCNTQVCYLRWVG